ncbi:MAG: tripartite tricarboxylate transporter permease [Woeseiaceae bacterium]|nr:tripartite tricarboxylate transporter permease [Woeseiaceae bacterium]
MISGAFTDLVNSGHSYYIAFGVLVGLTFGVIPGLGGTTALALLIPVTYAMDPVAAMYLAGGSMGATSFGGSMTAILLNTPGTPPNAATTFDGYPLTLQGKAGLAIGASATASALGGLIGLLSLLLVIPLAREIIFLFGPPEFFLLTILCLVAIAVAASGKLLRGLIAAGFGLMLTFVGMESVSGELRYTGDLDYLWDGVPLVPVLTGMFALSQMLDLALQGGSIVDTGKKNRTFSGVTDGIKSVFRNWPHVIRGSVIGTVIGAIPGLGGVAAAFFAYSSAAQTSKDPDSFGKGNIIGVIAPESANNAKDGASLLPAVAFGIPGSAESALLLSILILHGIEPGPTILIDSQREIYGLILAITFSAVGASIIGLLGARWLMLITHIKVHILIPIVMSVTLAAVYALEGKVGDVILCAIMGVIGYLMIRFDYPRLTFIIALVLGRTMEQAYHQSVNISDGNLLAYIADRPTAVVLAALIVLTLLFPGLRKWIRQRD